ncbi:MAG: hypothetical protein ACRDZZ_06740 [Ilumatobacteraceae bacterium]
MDDRQPTDPAPLRVGVTGHRRLADAAGVADAVERELDALDGDRGIELWSALAEGADRLVAERALERPGTSLVVVLPLVADDYSADFPDTVDEFDRLLDRAVRIEVCGPDDDGSRESAYERAGLMIVDSCDVLIAVWDGGPSGGRGGTAEIVDAARRIGRRTIVIPAERAGRRPTG